MFLEEHLWSAGCVNYALRRISVGNVVESGKEAADIMQNNFDVDDLLKSVKDTSKIQQTP